MVGGLTGGVHVLQALPASQVLHALQNASAPQLQAMQAAIASSAAAWGVQNRWDIDSVHGSDADTGLAGHPLQTASEYARRVILAGGHKFAGETDINFLADTLPTDEPRGVVPVFGSTGSTVYYKGANGITNVRNGIFSAVTAPAPATNTFFLATDSLGTSWAAFISILETGIRVRNTTAGARLDSKWWPWKNLAAGQCQFSQPMVKTVPAAGPFGQAMATAPSVNDTYAVEQLPRIVGPWGLQYNIDNALTSQFNGSDVVVFSELCFGNGTFSTWPSLTANGRTGVSFYDCDTGFMASNAGPTCYVNCRSCFINSANGGYAQPGEEHFIAGLRARDLRLANPNGFFLQRFACDTLIVQGDFDNCSIESLQANVGGVQITGGGTFVARLGVLAVFGLCSGTHGIQLVGQGSLAKMRTTTGITITGSTGNVKIGDAVVVTKTYAQLPFLQDGVADAATRMTGVVTT